MVSFSAFGSSSLVLAMIDEKMKSKSIGLIPHKIHFILLYVLSLLVFFLTVSEAVCNLHDRDSLLLFSTNVSSSISPLHWNTSIDCCSWEGISCDDSPENRVTSILLPYRGLSGHLASSVLNLHRLSRLDLSHNRLSGPLPQGFLSALDQLLVLDLSYNSFKGELPLEQPLASKSNRTLSIQTVDLSSNHLHGEILGDSVFIQGAFSLTSFNVSNNSFTGPIPIFMCTTSPHLTKLDFSYNDFTGDISQGLGKCSKLSAFRAGYNNLSGEIPKDIYMLSELEQLFLPVNHLSGKIDDKITRLNKLTLLELYINDLEGEIPKEIGKLFNLQSLQLHINSLTGSIPVSLANCTKLMRLNLRVNKLGGSLSKLDFSQFQSLSILDLGNNSFTGDFPSTLYSCKNLTAMRFAGNQLTGQISPEILNLESLSFFTYSDNKMTNITGALTILQGCKKLSTLIIAKNYYDETIPSNPDFLVSNGFPSLQIFGIGACRLKGKIPAWLINLKNVEVMDMSVNKLEGSIPGWLGSLPNLFYLDLTDNLFTGVLPTELFELTALTSERAYDATERTYLELPVFVSPTTDTTNQQYNQLSSLPPAIYIRRNNLTGSIPIEVGKLKVLHVLELQSNNFFGSIPDELSNLTNLERLDLSTNNLSGRIPWSFRKLHFMSYFNVANNSLSGPVPTGGQFDTFRTAYFEGNPLLCGGVLLTSCNPIPNHPSTTTKMEKVEVKRTLISGLVIGFSFGISLSVSYHLASGLLAIKDRRRKKGKNTVIRREANPGR